MIIGGFFIPFFVMLTFNMLVVDSLKSKTNNIKYKMDICIDKKSASTIKLERQLISLRKNIKPNRIANFDPLNRKKNLIKRIFLNSYQKNTEKIFKKRERKVTKTLILHFIAVCVIWFPYACVVIISQLLNNSIIHIFITPVSASLPALFTKSVVIVYPLVYFFSNNELKNYIKNSTKLKINETYI